MYNNVISPRCAKIASNSNPIRCKHLKLVSPTGTKNETCENLTEKSSAHQELQIRNFKFSSSAISNLVAVDTIVLFGVVVEHQFKKCVKF